MYATISTDSVSIPPYRMEAPAAPADSQPPENPEQQEFRHFHDIAKRAAGILRRVSAESEMFPGTPDSVRELTCCIDGIQFLVRFHRDEQDLPELAEILIMPSIRPAAFEPIGLDNNLDQVIAVRFSQHGPSELKYFRDHREFDLSISQGRSEVMDAARHAMSKMALWVEMHENAKLHDDYKYKPLRLFYGNIRS